MVSSDESAVVAEAFGMSSIHELLEGDWQIQ